MVEKIVSFYQNARRGFISSFSGIQYRVLEEAGFYDVGYMKSQIKRIQKELKKVTDNVQVSITAEKSSDSVDKYRDELMRKREELIYYMIFMLSNSFNNLDYCIKLSEGFDFPFMDCVYGLQEYNNGNKNKAFEILERYYIEHGSVSEHFLINKTFGILLLERGEGEKAKAFLSYALQFIPDDIECINRLRICYKQKKDAEKIKILVEIIEVLS